MDELIKELGKDVFYGDERTARFGQHNPLHMEAINELRRLQADKDSAYLERNRLVAALASLFPSGIARTDIPGWLPEWHGCVYVDLPTGQASWHYHDSQAHLFAHLPPYTKAWDGHSTDEKYQRLAALHSRGLAVVPVEPTPAMLASVRWDDDDAREGYQCMLSARPEGA